jgi:hypothetical protein
MPRSNDYTVIDRLAFLGFGYHGVDSTPATGRLEVYELSSGKPVGRWTAVQAGEFVRAWPPGTWPAIR